MSTSNQNVLPQLNAFEMLKRIHEKPTETVPMEDIADDVTVAGAHIQKLVTTRISMMVTIDEVAKVKAKAASEAANEVLEAIVNQFPDVRVARWEADKPTTNDPTLLHSLPEEVNDVEPYMHGFTRFFGKPKGYFRLNLCHSEETSAGAINRFCNANLRVQGQQFVQVAHSSAKDPIVVGFFTGSTPEMASSGDVTTLFQQLFGLKDFGLYWNNIRTSQKNQKWSKDRFAMHLEMDEGHMEKDKIISVLSAYFNHSISDAKRNFLGTPMVFVPIFKGYLASAAEQNRITQNAKKQMTMMGTLREVTLLSSVCLLNLVNEDNDTTLMEALMTVESITEKTVERNGKSKSFKGRLFYSILTDKEADSCTFTYFAVNEKEAQGVANGLPLFIEDFFDLEAATFCRSAFVAEAKNGHWTKSTRHFMTQEEKEEQGKLDIMEDLAIANVIEFISSDHQRAMAMNDDDANTLGTDLRNKSPRPLEHDKDKDDDVSALSNSTRTSKAQLMASAQIKELAKQYAETFEAQRKMIEDLKLQVTSAHSTPAKMPENQVAPVTISKPPQSGHGDGNSYNSDATPKDLNAWREDDEDQRNDWNSPPATKNDDAMDGKHGNQDEHLDHLSDTDDSEDDSTGGVKYIRSIAPPPATKRRIEESSSDDESSDEEDDVEQVDNVKSPERYRKGRDDKAALPITSHRATRSSKRQNNITNSRGPGVGQDP